MQQSSYANDWNKFKSDYRTSASENPTKQPIVYYETDYLRDLREETETCLYEEDETEPRRFLYFLSWANFKMFIKARW